MLRSRFRTALKIQFSNFISTIVVTIKIFILFYSYCFSIRKISEHLKKIPPAAIEFTIDIEPMNGVWEDECLDIVNEVALS